MKGNQHVGVIGGGIIGLCTALNLQKEGFKVSIIDRKGIAKECSKGNAGHFATEQVFPLADKHLLPKIPKMLLDPLGPFRIRPRYFLKALPWFLRFIWQMRKQPYARSTKQLTLLNEHSINAYQTLLRELDLTHLIHLKGSLLVFESTCLDEIEQIKSRFVAHEVPAKVLNKSQLNALEPNLSDNITAAIHFETGGHTTDPEALCIALAQVFIEQGGQLIIDDVAQINTGNKLLIKTERSHYEFDKLVIATGAWSKTLANQLGYNVPLDTERGYHLMLPQTNLLNRPVTSAERKFIMTPMASGLRLAGTVEFAGLQAPMNNKRAEILLPHARAILKEHIHPPSKSAWMGFRPSLPDSLPVIGQAPKHSNIFFAFGHHHLGLTHGAITGELITQQIKQQPTTIDLSPFCISRFN